MKPKYNKGEKVILELGAMYGIFKGPSDNTRTEVVIIDINNNDTSSGEIKYKVKGYTGWWPENFLKEID